MDIDKIKYNFCWLILNLSLARVCLKHFDFLPIKISNNLGLQYGVSDVMVVGWSLFSGKCRVHLHLHHCIKLRLAPLPDANMVMETLGARGAKTSFRYQPPPTPLGLGAPPNLAD